MSRVVNVRKEDIQFVQYAIYENPSDYPGRFVLRKWVVVRGNPNPLASPFPTCIATTIEVCRNAIPPGMVMIKPKGGDPSIVEEWI